MKNPPHEIGKLEQPEMYFKEHSSLSAEINPKIKAVFSDCKVSATSLTSLTSLISHAPPNAVDARGVWDTGATATAISNRIVKKLGLLPVARSRINTARGLTYGGVYVVDLIIGKMANCGLWVTGVDIAEHIDVLIGMDIILLGEFAISHGKFSYCSPPCGNPVDLAQKAERANEKIRKKQRR